MPKGNQVFLRREQQEIKDINKRQELMSKLFELALLSSTRGIRILNFIKTAKRLEINSAKRELNEDSIKENFY